MISLEATELTSSSSSNASIIFLNLRALSNSSISTSLLGIKSIFDSKISIDFDSKNFSTE
jgi:hypothetical protein